MDGENNGKPGFKMDDLWGKPIILGNPHIYIYIHIKKPLGMLELAISKGLATAYRPCDALQFWSQKLRIWEPLMDQYQSRLSS